jgi:hypothetical protein
VDRVHHAEHVRAVRDRDQPRLLPDELLEVRDRHAPVGSGIGLVIGDESLGRHLRERAVDRVVLGVRGDHVVPLTEEPLDRDVQAVGRVQREGDPVRAFRVEKAGDRFAAALDALLRFHRHPMP